MIVIINLPLLGHDAAEQTESDIWDHNQVKIRFHLYSAAKILTGCNFTEPGFIYNLESLKFVEVFF